jgi:hypothetical protein
MADIESEPKVRQIDPMRIFPEVGITWAGGTINVTNVEKDTFIPEYVTGVSSLSNAQALWECGRLLYIRYGLKNAYPKALADCSALATEADAVAYCFDQYRLAGCAINSGVMLYERYTVSFVVSTAKVFGQGLELGKKIRLVYPNIAPDEWGGYITGIGYDYSAGTVEITGEFRGEFAGQLVSTDIVETGTAETNIVETGTATDQYLEV